MTASLVCEPGFEDANKTGDEHGWGTEWLVGGSVPAAPVAETGERSSGLPIHPWCVSCLVCVRPGQ